MDNEKIRRSWSLHDLNHEFYAQLGIPENVTEATLDVIQSISNPEMDPEQRFAAYKALDNKLQGENAIHRMPVLLSLCGAVEVQAAVANGCGPSGLGIFPGGWWEHCCIDHDECYAQGGGAAAKLICDAKFWKCLWTKGAPIVAELYGLAVFLFGWPAFDWDGPTPPPNRCAGPCKGIEYRVTDLRDFRVGRSANEVLLNDVPASGRRALEAEALDKSKTEWSQRCASGCRCKLLIAGEWRRNVTVLIAPGNDLNNRVNYYCNATSWSRDVSGVCE